MHHLQFQDMPHQHQHLQGHILNPHQPHLIPTLHQHLQQMNTLLHQTPLYQTMMLSLLYLNIVLLKEQEGSERGSPIKTKATNVQSVQSSPSLIQDHLLSSIEEERVPMRREQVVFRPLHHQIQDQLLHLDSIQD